MYDPMHASEETRAVLLDIAQERRRQVNKGWTPEHDDTHSTDRMIYLAVEGRLPTIGTPNRKQMIECIAMLVAAVEAMDRVH